MVLELDVERKVYESCISTLLVPMFSNEIHTSTSCMVFSDTCVILALAIFWGVLLVTLMIDNLTTYHLMTRGHSSALTNILAWVRSLLLHKSFKIDQSAHNSHLKLVCSSKKRKMNVRVFYLDMWCPFTTSLSCPCEHESGKGEGGGALNAYFS